MKTEFKRVFDKLREGENKNVFPFDRWGEGGSWFSPDLCTYNCLIHVLFLLGKVEDGLVVWEELKGLWGLEPDGYTYRIVIQGCGKAYRINDAIIVFTEMQYNGIGLDTVVYNSLLDGLFKARKLTDACKLFQKMIEDDGVRASCWTYNILIDGLFKNGKERLVKHITDSNLVPIIIRLIDSMEATMKAPQSREKDFTPIFPSNGDFGDILSRENFTDAGTDTALGAEDADIHYQESDPWSSSPHMDMLANKVISQSNSTNTFPLTGGKQIDTKGADSFDIDMVNTLLSIFLAKGKLSMACKLFEIFIDMGADPASYTYNSMMSSFVKKGYFNGVRRFAPLM
ncbi:hypothetical protein BC332_16433 [Capsicum chinense]|nr:hypothetical protein BC332_16433 [Capsicum chinense]